MRYDAGVSPADARPATRDWIDDLLAEGLLTPPQAHAAAVRLRAAAPTRWLADRLMALAGTCLILAGIVFFFAYNWHAMPPLQKFALIELALILCIAVTLRRGVDDLIERLFALAAAVFVGVFLAVLGQVYQTGADPWQLFAAWAVLILPWCALVPFAALWALFIVVADTALCLYVGEAMPAAALAVPCLGVAAIHGVGLIVRERIAQRRDDVAQETWLRQFLLAGVLGALTVPSCATVGGHGAQTLDVFGLGLWAAITAAVWVFYTRRAADLFPLAMAALGVCCVVLWFLASAVLAHDSNPFSWLMFGLMVVGVFSTAAAILRGVMRSMMASGRNVE